MANDDLSPPRARAYELADTGRYEDWETLSAELVAEGTHEAPVRQLTHDVFFQIMIKNRIAAARG